MSYQYPRKKEARAIKIIAVTLTLAVIAGIGYLIRSSVEKAERAGYEAWTRDSGNPARLTFDQWLAMPKPYGY